MSLLRPVVILVLCFSLALSLTGCYSRSEIEDIGFIVSWGLEKGEKENYKVIVQIAAPSKVSSKSGGGGGEEPPYWLGQAEGETFFAALRELAKRSSRQLHFSHAEALIIQEEVAREGLAPIIDILTRNSDMRPRMSIFITSEKIKNILEVTPGLENLPSTYITKLERRIMKHEETVHFEVKDFYTQMQPGNEALIPRISTWQEPNQTEGQNQGGSNANLLPASTGSTAPKDQGENKELILEGAAVFRDTKMIDWLNSTETYYLKWLRGEVVDGPMIISLNGCSFSLRVRETNRFIKIIPNVKSPGSSRIELKIIAETDLVEVEKPAVAINNDLIAQIEQAASENLERELNRMLSKVKYDLETDVLGFGELVRRKIPHSIWERYQEPWNSEFQNLIIQVSTNIQLRRLGMTIQSPFIY